MVTSLVWSLLGFVLLIGILVTIHEWGHYAVGRWFKVKAEVFSVGFGKPIWTKQWGETQFQIAMIPLGGYVRFLDERNGPVEPADLDRAFNRQAVYKRFAIVAAGPLINLIFAWLLYVFIYSVGVAQPKALFTYEPTTSPVAQAMADLTPAGAAEQAWWITQVAGRDVYGWQGVSQGLVQALINQQETLNLTLSPDIQDTQPEQTYQISLPINHLDINQFDASVLFQLGWSRYLPKLPAKLGQIVAESPAQQAGLQAGDTIERVNGQAIESWQDLVRWIHANPGLKTQITYRRDGALFDTWVELADLSVNGEQRGQLGASVYQDTDVLRQYQQTQQLGLWAASVAGWEQTHALITMTLSMLKRMIQGDISLSHLSGPISIADFSGQAIQSGWVQFLTLMALLSLSLGILNLLPIPMLDGGHLTYYLYEMIRGKPVSEGFEMAAQRIGFLMIAGLTLLAISNDLVRLSNG